MTGPSSLVYISNTFMLPLWCNAIPDFVRTFLLSAALLIAQQSEAPASGCWVKKTPRAWRVLNVSDQGVLLLSDGRQLTLAGIRLPEPPLPLPVGEYWSESREAIRYIRSRVKDKNVRLSAFTPRPDRHGVIATHVYPEGGNAEIWLQLHLLKNGLARVDAVGARFPCVSALLAAEQQARFGKKGMWRNAVYNIRASRDIAGLKRDAGSFQIVQGVVQKAAEIKGRLYLNFGNNWRKDFTVKISRRNWKRFRLREIKAADYQGKAIRVRGWLEIRNGPMIEVEHPDLLEVVSDNKN